MLTVAFSMTTLSELAFVAAAVGHHELHLTSADTFAAVCLAILVSNCVGPALLRRTLRLYTEAALRDIAATVRAQAALGEAAGLLRGSLLHLLNAGALPAPPPTAHLIEALCL